MAIDGNEVVCGDLRFRRDDPHPAVPSLEPTFPLSFHREAAGPFFGVVPTGHDEVTALEGYTIDGWNSFPRAKQALLRIGDGKTTRIPLPDTTREKVTFTWPGGTAGEARSTLPEKAPLVFNAVVAADGTPLALGRRLSGELTGGESGRPATGSAPASCSRQSAPACARTRRWRCATRSPGTSAWAAAAA